MSKYGIIASRSGGSIFGRAAAWAKDNSGEPALFDTHEAARAQAKTWNDKTHSPNVYYTAAAYPGHTDDCACPMCNKR